MNNKKKKRKIPSQKMIFFLLNFIVPLFKWLKEKYVIDNVVMWVKEFFFFLGNVLAKIWDCAARKSQKFEEIIL